MGELSASPATAHLNVCAALSATAHHGEALEHAVAALDALFQQVRARPPLPVACPSALLRPPHRRCGWTFPFAACARPVLLALLALHCRGRVSWVAGARRHCTIAARITRAAPQLALDIRTAPSVDEIAHAVAQHQVSDDI